MNYRESPIPAEYVVQLDKTVINRFTYPVVKLWEYTEQIRNGQLRELAPLLVMLVDEPTAQTLQEERALILTEPDQDKRADLLALAVTLAARYFDREFLRRFFREELIQMQYATLIDEWLEEAVEKAVQETEVRATAKGMAEGMHDRAIVSILRILTVRFGVDTKQQEATRSKLDSISDLSKLDEAEDRALLAFTYAEFAGHLDSLLASQHRNGSGR